MIRTIALDDEPPALNIIKAFCSTNPDVSLEKVFTSTDRALSYINNNSIDLILLDINMPTVSGIDFYKRISQDIMVIFTTSYTEYAVESYAINAIDYLVKPYTRKRFNQAIKKALDLYSMRKVASQAGELYLTIRSDYGLMKVFYTDIIFIEGLDNYLKIHLTNKQPIVVRLTMKGLVEKLPVQQFIRVHRSYIVSLKHVSYCRNKLITLTNNEEIALGSSYEQEFMKRMT